MRQGRDDPGPVPSDGTPRGSPSFPRTYHRAARPVVGFDTALMARAYRAESSRCPAESPTVGTSIPRSARGRYRGPTGRAVPWPERPRLQELTRSRVADWFQRSSHGIQQETLAKLILDQQGCPARRFAGNHAIKPPIRRTRKNSIGTHTALSCHAVPRGHSAAVLGQRQATDSAIRIGTDAPGNNAMSSTSAMVETWIKFSSDLTRSGSSARSLAFR